MRKQRCKNEIRKLTKENSVLTFKIAKYEEEGEDTVFRKIEDLKKKMMD